MDFGSDSIYSHLVSDGSHSLRAVFDGVGGVDVYIDGSLDTTLSGVSTSAQSISLEHIGGVRAGASVSNLSLTSTPESSGGISSVSGAASLQSITQESIASAIQNVASFRAQNGALQNQLLLAGEQLSINRINLEAAKGRIVDVEVASESVQLARTNILASVGSRVLGQANDLQSIALRLIQ